MLNQNYSRKREFVINQIRVNKFRVKNRIRCILSESNISTEYESSFNLSTGMFIYDLINVIERHVKQHYRNSHQTLVQELVFDDGWSACSMDLIKMVIALHKYTPFVSEAIMMTARII